MNVRSDDIAAEFARFCVLIQLDSRPLMTRLPNQSAGLGGVNFSLERLDNLHRKSPFNDFLTNFTSLLISEIGLLLPCSTRETERISATGVVLRPADWPDAADGRIYGVGV